MSEFSAETGPPGGVKGEVTARELDRRERSMARRSAETRAIVPSLELSVTVDMEAALVRAASEPCPTAALVISCAAAALRLTPRLNGSYRDGRHEFYSRINIAVPLGEGDRGTMATLFDADTRSPAELAAELERLDQLAATDGLSAAETAGATFTVLLPPPGEGVHILTPFIQPPQAGTLAIGPTLRVPVVRGDTVRPGHSMSLTLACDHRIVQGAHGAAFLGEVKARLERQRRSDDRSA